jgi:hypothetical protein
MGKKTEENKLHRRRKKSDKKKKTTKIYGKEPPRSIRIKLTQQINTKKNKKEKNVEKNKK